MKYKVKDISHEMFQHNREELTGPHAWLLNWLEYMSDADVVYGGIGIYDIYDKEALEREWEIIKINIRYLFIKNKTTGKHLCVCLSKYKPLNYKNLSFEQLLQDKSSNINGVSKFEIHKGYISFRVYAYLEPTETTLMSLKTSRQEKDINTNLLEHAFIKKDIKIPISATVYIAKGGTLPYDLKAAHNYSGLGNRLSVVFDKNKNPHIDHYGCYGNHTQVMQKMLKQPDSFKIGLFVRMAVSNINLTDGGSMKSSLIQQGYVQEIEKDGRLIDINESNANKLCPPLGVNYDKVEQVIRRHQII